MERTRFDSLTRHLATAGSRREAMKALAVAGLSLGVGSLGVSSALAGGKKGIGQRCRSKDQCKKGLLCKRSDSQNSCYPGDPVERCCKKVGARCNDDCECCGVDVICNGGYCDKA